MKASQKHWGCRCRLPTGRSALFQDTPATIAQMVRGITQALRGVPCLLSTLNSVTPPSVQSQNTTNYDPAMTPSVTSVCHWTDNGHAGTPLLTHLMRRTRARLRCASCRARIRTGGQHGPHDATDLRELRWRPLHSDCRRPAHADRRGRCDMIGKHACAWHVVGVALSNGVSLANGSKRMFPFATVCLRTSSEWLARGREVRRPGEACPVCRLLAV